jgi:hypothetical protein
MKIANLKLNDIFLTDSGVKFQLLISFDMFTRDEKLKHPDRFKCVNLDTGEMFYLMDNMLIRKK